MKACVLYGPKDFRIEERPVSEPQPGFVRLRMGGVGICGSDLHYYHIGRVGNAVVRLTRRAIWDTLARDLGHP